MGSFKVAALVLLLSALASVSIAAVISTRDAAKSTAKTAPARATAKAPAKPAAPKVASVAKAPVIAADDLQLLAARRLIMPVQGYDSTRLRDNFDEARGTRRHDALDIMAPRGTPVVAVDDGEVTKLFTSAAGGITVYQLDPSEKFIYYYAHLDRYAAGLREGAMLKRGDVLGYVGSTGNAPASAPHLHFTIFQLGPDKKWWKGTAVNPYPYLTEAGR